MRVGYDLFGMGMSRRATLGGGGMLLAGTMLPGVGALAREGAEKGPDAAKSSAVLFQMISAPLTLAYEGAFTRGREQFELFNDTGFLVRATAETGEDVQLWVFFYQQRGKEMVIDGDLTQTALVVTDFSGPDVEKMHDTPFTNKGQSVEDYFAPGTMKIVETPTSVSWSIGGREMHTDGKTWRVTGEHAGVKTDLRFTPRGPGFFHVGRFEDLGTRPGAAGYQAHMNAEGLIEFQGRVLKVKGYAVHERIILSFPTLPPRLAKNRGAGSNWMHSFGDEFSFYILNAAEGGHATGMINMKGGEQYLAAGMENIVVEPIDVWVDPLTLQQLPRQWRIAMKTPQGDLHATMSANGRGYYYWMREGGLMIVNQFAGVSDATFTPKGGKAIVSRQLAHNEFMRTFYEQHA
ncbi:hypothetical protein [Novosphingobium sp. BL-52-GroH]|uniref:hypothetical protein n=1 Tax=Novosphingobium sp. BL-52-GroH TaxID=3349877 RepID=UPI00384C7951